MRISVLLINSLLILILLSFSACIIRSDPAYFTPGKSYHIVREGDNLTAISRRYNISIKEIKLYNNLVSDTIFPGQKLYLMPKPIRKTEFVTVRGIPESGHHIVVKGETIYRIAKMYDLNIIDLVEINNMTDLDLKRGEKLYLRFKDKKEEIATEVVTTFEEPVSEKVIEKEEVKIEKKELQSRKDIILPIKGKVTDSTISWK